MNPVDRSNEQLVIRPNYYFIKHFSSRKDDSSIQEPLLPLQDRISCIFCNEKEPPSLYEHINCIALFHLGCLNNHTIQTRSTDCFLCGKEIVIPTKHYIKTSIACALTMIVMQESAIGLKWALDLEKPRLSLFLAGISSGLILKNSYDLAQIHGACQHGLILPLGTLSSLLSSIAILSPHTIPDHSFDLFFGMSCSLPILIALSDNTSTSHAKLAAISMALLLPLLTEALHSAQAPIGDQQQILFVSAFTMSMMAVLLYCKPSYVKGRNYDL